MPSSTLMQFMRYNAIGIVNTLVGFCIIFALMFAGLSPVWSNAIGYFIGAILSYYLNSKYTFSIGTQNKIQVFKFFIVLALAYILNFFTLQYTLVFLNPYLAQLIAAAIYTFSSFILMKVYVFKEKV